MEQLDLYALECLNLVITERSVTRAAEKIGISQPSMSNIIARLRKTTGDALVVRMPEGMAPTPYGQSLVEASQQFVTRVQELAAEHSKFDPTCAHRTFVIRAVDFLVSTLIAKLCGHLRRTAPNISIIVGAVDLKQVRAVLERGDADLVLAPIKAMPDSLYASTLTSSGLCCIVAKDHPVVGDEIDIAQYAALPQIGLCLGDDNAPFVGEQVLDELVAKHGLARTQTVRVPSVLSVPAIVAQTDLLATVPIDLATAAARYLPIKILALPFEMPQPEYSIVWHARAHADPGIRWLRTTLRKAHDGTL